MNSNRLAAGWRPVAGASRGAPRGVTLSSAELLKLCMRLDSAGILALAPADEAEDISPIFAVRKKFDDTRGVWTLRLLFGRRRRNERERHLHGASRDLPHAACFLDIVLDAGQHIEIDASDLECFYYTARVSDKRAAHNVFGRPLPASRFATCACYDLRRGAALLCLPSPRLRWAIATPWTSRSAVIASCSFARALWTLGARCTTGPRFRARARSTAS